MSHPCGCVLGQLFGDYFDARACLTASGQLAPDGSQLGWAVDHGFDIDRRGVRDPDSRDVYESAFADLEREWVEYLKEFQL